jgi:DNA-binding NarL/FixJ family response regulator
MADWLLDTLRAVGYAGLWWEPDRPARVEGVAAAVYDMPDTRPADLARLGAFTATVAPAPVMALMHFPRRHEVDQAQAAGAAEVISKPASVGPLLERLARRVKG